MNLWLLSFIVEFHWWEFLILTILALALWGGRKRWWR